VKYFTTYRTINDLENIKFLFDTFATAANLGCVSDGIIILLLYYIPLHCKAKKLHHFIFAITFLNISILE